MAARILIVDDEPDMLALLRTIIRSRSNYEVSVTNNPLEVVEILEREPVDVVVTDLKMPGLDGIELTRVIQQRAPEVVVIVITAYGSPESAETAMEQGAFDFITKPFRKEQIMLALDKALRWQALLRRNRELEARLAAEEAGKKGGG